MRTAILVVLLVVSTLCAASAVQLGGAVALGWGEDKTPWNTKMLLSGTISGPVSPQEDVVEIRDDESLIAQVLFSKDMEEFGSDDFELYFSTLGNPGSEDWRRADFDPSLGWVFEVPQHAIARPGYNTPLHLRVKAKRTKASYARVLFKFTGAAKDTEGRETLFIRTYRPEASQSTNPEGTLGQQLNNYAAGQREENSTRDAAIATTDSNVHLLAEAMVQSYGALAIAINEARLSGNDNSAAIAKLAAECQSAIAKLNEALAKLGENDGKLAAAFDDVFDGLQDLTEAVNETRKQGNDTSAALAKFTAESQSAITKINEALAKLSANDGKLADGIADLSDGLQFVCTELTKTNEAVNAVSAALVAFKAECRTNQTQTKATFQTQGENIDILRAGLDEARQDIAQLRADRDAGKTWMSAASQQPSTSASAAASPQGLEPFTIQWMKGNAAYDGSIFLSTDGKLYKTPSVSTWVLPDGSPVQFDWSLDRQQWTSYHGVARRGAVVRIDVKNREVR